MSLFDDRQNGFETKFVHDAEMQFKLTARRDKLVGLWAAEKLGLAGDAADSYAKTLVIADLAEAGDDDIMRKLMTDLAGHNVSEADVRAALLAKAEEARQQIMAAM